jgi:hypothetical protein
MTAPSSPVSSVVCPSVHGRKTSTTLEGSFLTKKLFLTLFSHSFSTTDQKRAHRDIQQDMATSSSTAAFVVNPSPHTHTHTHTHTLSLSLSLSLSLCLCASLCASLCTWRVLLQRGLIIRKPSSLDLFSSASCCCYNIQIWTIETTTSCSGLKPSKTCKPCVHPICLCLSLCVSSRRLFSRVCRVRLFSSLVSSSSRRLSRASISKKLHKN